MEWREVFSVNDTIVTDFGALSIGEPWYQLRTTSSPGRTRRRASSGSPPGAWACTRCSTPHPAPSHREPDPPRARRLPDPRRRDHRLALPIRHRQLQSLGLRSRLALAPGYTAPGTERWQGWEVLSSTVNFTVDLEGGTARELDVNSGAVFYGRLERSVGKDSRGSGSILGIGSAFTLFRKDPVTDYDAGGFRVHRATTCTSRTPGTSATSTRSFTSSGRCTRGTGVARPRWSPGGLEAYPDFALVNAYALNDYSADHDISGMKTTQLYYGYYYGYGATLKARLEASVGPVTIGTAASAALPRVDRGSRSLRGRVVPATRTPRTPGTGSTPGSVGRYPGRPFAVEVTARWSSRRGSIGDTTVRGDGVALFPRPHLAPVTGC